MTDSPDTIELRGLRLVGLVGVLPEEGSGPSPWRWTWTWWWTCPSRVPPTSWSTPWTTRPCARWPSASSPPRCPELLERLALRLAEEALAADDRISEVGVVVRKLRPPVPQDLATSGVAHPRPRAPLG